MDKIELSKEEIDKLFEGCHSNLEAPLIGRIGDPICRTCKNLTYPENPFNPLQCSVYGEPPDDIFFSEQAHCEHYIAKKKK